MALVVSAERGRPRRVAAASLSASLLPFAMFRLSRCSAAGVTCLCLDEREHRAVARGRWHDNAASAANADSTQRLLRRRDIGHNHEPCAAALRQAGQRHAGIALAELILGQEYEV